MSNHMNLEDLLRSVGPKLVPFFKSLGIYFVVVAEQPSIKAACLKCLPIISLMIFILFYGMNLSDEYTISRRIFLGLVFSCLGDALLVWPSYFILGMIMFAVTQILYISAFGFKPLCAKLGLFLYAWCGLVIYILLPGLKGDLKIGVPIYTMLIGTMLWRSLARLQYFKKPWTWRELSSAIGSICFVISDTMLGINYFNTPFPYAPFLIMSTYYAGQLGIALSAVNLKIKSAELKKLD